MVIGYSAEYFFPFSIILFFKFTSRVVHEGRRSHVGSGRRSEPARRAKPSWKKGRKPPRRLSWQRRSAKESGRARTGATRQQTATSGRGTGAARIPSTSSRPPPLVHGCGTTREEASADTLPTATKQQYVSSASRSRVQKYYFYFK